jgi:HK97 family phage portal protein
VRDVFSAPQRKYDSLDLFREIYGNHPTWAGKSVTLRTAMQVSVAFSCGRVIAEGMAMLPFKVLQSVGTETNPAPDHSLYDKLASGPNPLQTGFEFVETMGLHLAFCGNSYAWINRVSRRVDELWLLEPGWVTTKYSFSGLPTYAVKSPDGSVNMELSADEVWHVRGPSWATYFGLDFVVLAREALGLSMSLEEGQAKIQATGGQVSGVLSVSGRLTEEQYKKLRGWLAKEHEGSPNAGRMMIIDNDAKFTANSMTNVDAQVADMRRFQIEEVCRYFRVLPIMAGHTDKSATYASAEQMFLAHAVHTIGPWIRRIEKSADKFLLSPDDRAKGYYTKFNEKALLRTSAETQANVLSRYVLSGIMTRNESRAVLDLNPIDGLDEPLAPANTFTGNPPTGDSQPSGGADPTASGGDGTLN